ncbi:RluA family pseudouridine synthase [Fructobacillus sp. CRL 2054]|uniref:RluA family pseudouridine synthase n=1 Tax=Fructobacillus sp. CRL 2054 TaxID=2763007 RepID=UPI002379B149|nr:RluA family pseudouridine synthase [Fructobacillus sp. CRL 2054]MDD9139265.1 RluA family pseudouridine synthase [Fructobacillus sp. CRL 2054]
MNRTYKKTIKIQQKDADHSIKDFLTKYLLPKHLRGQLRQERGIRVNGYIVSTAYQLAENDLLELTLTIDDGDLQGPYPANNACLPEILFESEDMLILNKAAGMKMHPHSPTETDTILNYVQAYLDKNESQSLGQPAKAYMTHRLDRATSGLVIIGKNPLAVPILNRQIKDKLVKKVYLARAEGLFLQSSGEFDQPIGRLQEDDRKRAICSLVDGGQTALTRYQVLSEDQKSQTSLVRLELETGRMHQLRVHLAANGHPIVGDDLYGGRPASRLYLNSSELTFYLPWTGEKKILQIANPFTDK